MKQGLQHNQARLPNVRNLKRACKKELYRAVKKLKTYISPEQFAEAEELYIRKVAANFPWISEHHSNRRVLCDWWDKEVCPDIAQLWNVQPEKLAKAFRDAYGG